jgi:hypothetical protein
MFNFIKKLLTPRCKNCFSKMQRRASWDSQGGPIKKGRWNYLWICTKCKEKQN